MMACPSAVPIVDFSVFGLHQEEDTVDEETLQPLVQAVKSAFIHEGFMYITNHGISPHKLAAVQQCTDAFFALPTDVKNALAADDPTDRIYGYGPLEEQTLNTERPPDYKETFEVPYDKDKHGLRWPDAHVAGFRDSTIAFMEELRLLAFRILKVMAIALHLKDTDFFVKCHQGGSKTTMRILNYPAIQTELPPGQIWCGEHSDWGSITLLLQDSIGGLEIYKNGEFVAAPPVPGSVIVNVGDAMQRWSSDVFTSTVHRVVAPAGGVHAARRCYALFCNPNNDVIIESLTEDRKYPPVQFGEYITRKIKTHLKGYQQSK